MSLEPEFLGLGDILYIHEKQLEAYGGLPGVRARELLESALAVPQSSFGGEFLHNGIFLMAAAYAFHIAENQPFIDGNKRTALAAALLFLDLNGIELDDPDGALYQAMLDIASGKMSKEDLGGLLEKLASKTI